MSAPPNESATLAEDATPPAEESGPSAAADTPSCSEASPDEHKEQLLAAIDAMRASTKNVTTSCLGWSLTYTLRKQPGSSTRGDMMVIDPSDGQKLFSIVSIKRKLGMIATAPPREASSSTDDGQPPPARRGFDWDAANLVIEGSRRSRTVINYAEAAGGSARRTSDLILTTISEADPERMTGLDLKYITQGVHDRGETESDILPFAGVRLSVKSLLKSGRLRRRLIDPQLCSAEPKDSAPIHGGEGMRLALRMLLLQTLQVEEDEGAPWAAVSSTNPPSGIATGSGGDGGDDGRDGVTEAEGNGEGDGTVKEELIGGIDEATEAAAAESTEPRGDEVVARSEAADAAGEAGATDGQQATEADVGSVDNLTREGDDTSPEVAATSVEAAANAAMGAGTKVARTRDASHPGFAAGQGSAPLLYASVRVQLKGANYANAPELQAIDAGMVFAGSEYEREINDFCAENTKPPANQGRGRPKASASKKKRPRYEEAEELDDDDDGSGGDDDAPRGARGSSSRSGSSRAAHSSRAARSSGRAAKSKYAEDSDYELDDEGDDDDDEYEYVDDSDDEDFDGGKKRKRRVVGIGGGGGGGGGGSAGSGPPYVESLLGVKDLVNMLPIADVESCFFRAPPGWSEVQVEGSRRRKSRWVQYAEDGTELRAFDRRQELEATLEAEAASAGATWLGQLEGATWEISPKAAPAALTLVLDELVSLGLVSRVAPVQSGRAVPLYAVANDYFRGEAFDEPEKRAKAAMTQEERKAAREKRKQQQREQEQAEFEESYDELAELEKQRLRNIERNKELLRQLGLA